MTTSDTLPRLSHLLTAGMAAGLLMLAACESSSRSMVGPSGTRCEISIPASPPSVSAAGGAGSLAITAARECLWSATTAAAWITIADGSGQGDGMFRYSVAANPAPARRHGELVIGNQRTDIIQEGAPCAFTVAPETYVVGAGGEDFPVSVHTSEGCSWTAAEDVPWAEIVGASNVTGPGTVRLRVDPNTGGDRRATLSIAARTVVVEQAGAGTACLSAITPGEVSVTAAGGPFSVNVTAADGCGWTAASEHQWIAVTSSGAGSGPGTVGLSIMPNVGLPRTGTVLIAGRTFTVIQAGAATTCSYLLSPTARSMGAAGGAASVSVTAPGGCTWMVASQDAWIRVTAGASGSGDGIVGLSIGANAGVQRVGTVTIADKVFTMTQAAATPCSYGLSPTAQSLGAAGAAVSVAVTTPGGCAWTAESHVAWMTVTSGASGSGAGTVSLAIAANPGPQRAGTVSIADQVFTVTQAAGATCSYSLNPRTQTVPLLSLGTFTVSVDTQPGCAWTAAAGDPWITITNGRSGTGSGTVTYSVAISLFARTGTMTIAGESLAVHQGGLLLTER